MLSDMVHLLREHINGSFAIYDYVKHGSCERRGSGH